MSMITDALKKAESRSGIHHPPPAGGPSPKRFRTLLAALTLLTLAGLTVLAKTTHSIKAERPVPAGTTARAQTVSSMRVPFLAERQLALNGIVREEGGKSLALIGNRTVAEGEMVAGAKLVRIGLDEVELEKEGKETTLKLKN